MNVNLNIFLASMNLKRTDIFNVKSFDEAATKTEPLQLNLAEKIEEEH